MTNLQKELEKLPPEMLAFFLALLMIRLGMEHAQKYVTGKKKV